MLHKATLMKSVDMDMYITTLQNMQKIKLD